MEREPTSSKKSFYPNQGSQIYWGSIRILVLIVITSLITMVLVSCAPITFYSIRMNYVPQQTMPFAAGSLEKLIIAVTVFRDKRDQSDRNVIGKRVKLNGKEIKVLSKYMDPGRAVASAVRDSFIRSGYTVSDEMPSWNLTVESMEDPWGTLVVGGAIDELAVTCRTGFLFAQYDTRVKLRIVYGDIRKGRILYKTTLESTASLRHIRFSEEKMEQEINNAISAAVEKIFDHNKLENIIKEIRKSE